MPWLLLSFTAVRFKSQDHCCPMKNIEQQKRSEFPSIYVRFVVNKTANQQAGEFRSCGTLTVFFHNDFHIFHAIHFRTLLNVIRMINE